MKITIDTKEDSADDIRKVIKILQDTVEPQGFAPQTEQNAGNAFSNMFADNSQAQSIQEESKEQEPAKESSESTEDLFAELFSEEELKKMEPVKDEPEEQVPKGKKPAVEFY